ncbi:MAG: proton-conducting transporter membrane subunit [Bacteroidales bacterium]|jgi:formate hydrogenlyase subunit 3/multisubunit Na+/H+ antiporter MnhD subunit|nr:proton-conducting transporter membrane subunit [Bacteroidales bacterium]
MSLLFFLVIILTVPVFIVPKQYKYHYSLILLLGGIIATTIKAFVSLGAGSGACETGQTMPAGPLEFSADALSAFFILVVNITVLTGFLYSRGYLKPYYKTKNSLRFSLHYFSYLWLWLSMIMVLIVRDGFMFLIVWEIMALSSFILVIFDAEDTRIMKTGISYLIQMHVGMFLLLLAFLISAGDSGKTGFDVLQGYFSGHSNVVIFLLFFAGFGIKAGFIPFHTWLPQAHPAAPSHVSGVMSGVMIKMGIYGIMRVLISVQHNHMEIGVIILFISLLSAIMGVMMAIMQHDLKKLLAYHSIENIGIIGIGLGLGTIGFSAGNSVLCLLGYSGALLHVLNHSLFKSLLFFNAGSVYYAAHTRNVESLGGLMKKMPFTALLFLAGSLAICGLPPFNGFISEYLIYAGMFKSLASASLYQSLALLASIAGLALTGGLAVFCFTKAFGIVFLGQPRTIKAAAAEEVHKGMLIPQLLPLSLIILIGLASPFFLKPVFDIVSGGFGLEPAGLQEETMTASLGAVSILGGIFVVLTTILLIVRKMHLATKEVSSGPVWGCGYPEAGPAQQYTATSYVYNYNHLARPLLQTEKIMEDIREDEIFPAKRSFRSESHDVFRKYLVDKPVDFVSRLLKLIAVMQTGRIQHYILYAFLFMLAILLLTYFGII